jgi:hypothetical protein
MSRVEIYFKLERILYSYQYTALYPIDLAMVYPRVSFLVFMSGDDGAGLFVFLIIVLILWFYLPYKQDQATVANLRGVTKQEDSRLVSIYDQFKDEYPQMEDSFNEYKSLLNAHSYRDYERRKKDVYNSLKSLKCEDTSDAACTLAITAWINSVELFINQMHAHQSDQGW